MRIFIVIYVSSAYESVGPWKETEKKCFRVFVCNTKNGALVNFLHHPFPYMWKSTWDITTFVALFFFFFLLRAIFFFCFNFTNSGSIFFLHTVIPWYIWRVFSVLWFYIHYSPPFETIYRRECISMFLRFS